jgi:hypothetical protein
MSTPGSTCANPIPKPPFLYPRAVANWTYTNISPQCILNAGTDGTMPSVWFGRYGSLRTMTWTTPEDTVANFTKIYHVFAVHGVFQSYEAFAKPLVAWASRP